MALLQVEWEEVRSPLAGHPTLRVASWNILADRYSRTMKKVPKQFLNWPYRRKKINQTLRGLAADIICLQEVDGKGRKEVCGDMQSNGYDAYHAIRPLSNTKSPDGCSLLARRDCGLVLVDAVTVDFDDLLEGGDDRETDRQYATHNVGQVVTFCLEGGDGSLCHLVVANAHLHWKPARADVKLCQALLLLDRLVTAASRFPAASTAALVMGDLNSLPGSQVHSLLAKGMISVEDMAATASRAKLLYIASVLHEEAVLTSHLAAVSLADGEEEDESKSKSMTYNPYGRKSEAELKLLSDQEVAEWVVGRCRQAAPSLRFESAYQQREQSEQFVTNCTSDFSGCLDYIWCSNPSPQSPLPSTVSQKKTKKQKKNRSAVKGPVSSRSGMEAGLGDSDLSAPTILVTRYRKLPALSALTPFGGFPGQEQPSDHILIAAEVSLFYPSA